MPAATSRALPDRSLTAWSATQSSAAGSPGSKNDQAAFQSVDEVHDDVDGDLSAGGLGFDGLDLGSVAVHQRDPGPLMAGVAAGGLVEDVRYHEGNVVGDRGGQPLALGDRPAAAFQVRPAARTGDDVRGGAWYRGGVVDAAEFGHAFAAGLLSW